MSQADPTDLMQGDLALVVSFRDDGHCMVLVVPVLQDPLMWGFLIADLVAHVAKTYAHVGHNETKLGAQIGLVVIDQLGKEPDVVEIQFGQGRPSLTPHTHMKAGSCQEFEQGHGAEEVHLSHAHARIDVAPAAGCCDCYHRMRLQLWRARVTPVWSVPEAELVPTWHMPLTVDESLIYGAEAAEHGRRACDCCGAPIEDPTTLCARCADECWRPAGSTGESAPQRVEWRAGVRA